MTFMRAYRVTVPELIVIATDECEAREWATTAAEDAVVQRLMVAELRAHGAVYPSGYYDPDREMTCEEIADAMVAEGRTQ